MITSNCWLQRPTLPLFNHSELQKLELQNLAIFPSFSTFSSPNANIYWANVNFQPIGKINSRLWQFQGSGYTNQNSVEIIFTIYTNYNILFEGPASGVITTSSSSNALNANLKTLLKAYSQYNSIIIKIKISNDDPLHYFGFNLYKNDNCGCSYVTAAGNAVNGQVFNLYNVAGCANVPSKYPYAVIGSNRNGGYYILDANRTGKGGYYPYWVSLSNYGSVSGSNGCLENSSSAVCSAVNDIGSLNGNRVWTYIPADQAGTDSSIQSFNNIGIYIYTSSCNSCGDDTTYQFTPYYENCGNEVLGFKSKLF